MVNSITMVLFYICKASVLLTILIKFIGDTIIMIDKNSTLYYKFNKMKEFVRHINMAEVALEAFEDEEILSWKKHFIKSEAFAVIENMCSEIEYYMNQYNNAADNNANTADNTNDTKTKDPLNTLLV